MTYLSARLRPAMALYQDFVAGDPTAVAEARAMFDPTTPCFLCDAEASTDFGLLVTEDPSRPKTDAIYRALVRNLHGAAAAPAVQPRPKDDLGNVPDREPAERPARAAGRTSKNLSVTGNIPSTMLPDRLRYGAAGESRRGRRAPRSRSYRANRKRKT